MHQSSILVPLLVNSLYMRFVLLLDQTYFISSADGNTSYTVYINANDVVKSLEETSKLLIEWFKDEKMKLNLDKC